ncbi:hypothetical protein AWC31_11455 [Mycolicibacterium wolinskyi]|uniref:DUF7159 domain-containing protein n=1 Tax=Mycolicibacterium wolinskyi TaxID=59750 RepID=A0A1X2ER61_9MYCO|nr:hypothetical protein AWC31_11455 [Mycolicibacterium wolinskyi]
MKTVLGLSVTSDGVGWVLVDGDAPDGTPLDDDAFDVDTADELADRGAAAARGARSIAASSGQEVRAVGVTWSEDVDAEARQLIAALAAAGFADVRVVPGADRDDDAAEPKLSLAQAAARAVATGAIAVQRTQPDVDSAVKARRFTGLRVGGAAAAAVVIAVLVVGSQSVPEALQPAPEPPTPASAGNPQVVSVAVPLVGTKRPAVVEPGADESAERADRTPVYEPTEAFDTAVVESSPVVQAAQPAATIEPPVSAPEPASAVVAHLPVAALPGPAGPQLFAPGPVPAAATAPAAAAPQAPVVAQAPGVAQAPVAEPAPAIAPPPPPIFVNPFLAGLP